MNTKEYQSIHNILKSRWSPKRFSKQNVEHDKILAMLEAARWAPSSMNEQPWAFVVITKDNADEFNTLLSCLSERNQRWAQEAPLLLVSAAKLYHDYNSSENRYAFHDVGQAVAHLSIQATAMGLFVRQMGGFDKSRVREVLHMPQEYEPVTVLAIGYLPEKDQASPLLHRQIGERMRKPLDAFVFRGMWKKSFIEKTIHSSTFEVTESV